MRPIRVTVLGAGDAGVCLAAAIAAAGHPVTVWNRSASRLDSLAPDRGVLLRRPGQPDVHASLARATDLAAACADAELVLVTVSSDAQSGFVASHWPALRAAAAVVLVPGHTGGVLAALHALGRSRQPGDAVLAEMPLPFIGRRVGEAYTIHLYKTGAPVAIAAPEGRAAGILERIQGVIPTATVSDGLLPSMLSNTTAVLQPALACANADAIREGRLRHIYVDAMTAAAAELAMDLDEERLALAAALKSDVPGLTEWFTAAYRVAGRDIREAVGNCPALHGIPAPTTLDHRFATEHVRTGAVPLAQLARVAGTPHRHLDALAARLSQATGLDLVATGRSLADLGLDEATDATDLRDRIETVTWEHAR